MDKEMNKAASEGQETRRHDTVRPPVVMPDDKVLLIWIN